ncbi:MAG: hypothetical protein [Siphoviridae sp. ctCJE6]|nr:MAG: hypothetical protein [Siphoviridae sp. ctCJE6]
MVRAKFVLKKDFKNYLKLRKWSVNDLAVRLGKKKQQVSSIVNGRIEPSMNFLHALCELTVLKLEDIIETKFQNQRS